MPFMITASEKLSQIFETIPEIELVYQFGSSVKGRKERAKDVDVGVLLKQNTAPERQFEIYDLLSDRLSRLFRKKTDIAMLNKSSPMFNYQVLKTGHLIHGDVRRAKQFVVATLTRYFDYLPLHQFFVAQMKKRLGVRSHGR